MGAAARATPISVWTPTLIEAAGRTAAGKLPSLAWFRTSPDVPYRALLADDDMSHGAAAAHRPDQGALMISHRPRAPLIQNSTAGDTWKSLTSGVAERAMVVIGRCGGAACP
jgi:hypothetical protein